MSQNATEEAGILVRFMDVTDLDQVLTLEAKCFSTPWTREAFYSELVKNQFAYYTVAVAEGKIIAYCGLWVVVGDGHITNIAVDPEWRRQGIGERLLKGALVLAVKLGADRLSLEVRLSNVAAQNLYRKYGFQKGGIRKNYYTDTQEDAQVMWVGLTDEKRT